MSPLVSQGLKNEGYDSVHVRDYGMQTAPDIAIFARAKAENRTIISADTDFAMILAQQNTNQPSVVLFRHSTERNPKRQIEILRLNLPALKEVIERGSLIVLEQTRIRVRSLPLGEMRE